MPLYFFRALDASGKVIRSSMMAFDRNALVSAVRDSDMRLLKIESEARDQKDLWRQLGDLHPWHYIRPTGGQVELMLEQLSVLLRSGMSLLTSLKTVAEQARFRPLRQTVSELSHRIQTGNTLADAMQRHSCFPELIVQLIRVGEQTGELDYVCEQAAHQLARQRANRSKFLTAIAYPTFVATAALAVATFMVLFVIPKVQTFLTGLGRQLPPMTQRLMDLSTWIQANGIYVAVAAVGCISLTVMAYRTERGRLTIDRWILNIPILGNVFRLSGTVSFASAMAVLTRSGVTILDGLQTVERLQANRHLAGCVGQIRRTVLDGGDMSGALHRQQGFSPMLAGMVRVGEDTGQLDEVLEHVAQFHDTQLEKLIRRLGAMLEPAIIIVVGAMVGYVYMSFFVAIYNVGGSVR